MREKRIYGIKRTDRAHSGDEELTASEAVAITHGLTREEAEALRRQLTEQHPADCYFITVSELRFR